MRRPRPASRLRAPQRRPTRDRLQLTAAVRLWRSARALAGSPGENYLRARGVAHVADCPDLRYHPFCRHPSGVLAPAMVAAVRLSDGVMSGVHRTYLDGASKAALTPAKAMLGRCSGGAVRLVEATDGGLLVGEGLESTAAAVRVLDWRGGAWACLSTSGLRAVRLPEHIGTVTVAADRDHGGAGLVAAAELARRLEGEDRTVTICVPDQVGADFADVLAEAATWK